MSFTIVCSPKRVTKPSWSFFKNKKKTLSPFEALNSEHKILTQCLHCIIKEIENNNQFKYGIYCTLVAWTGLVLVSMSTPRAKTYIRSRNLLIWLSSALRIFSCPCNKRCYHPDDNFHCWWQETIKELNRLIIVLISSVSLLLKFNTAKCYMKKIGVCRILRIALRVRRNRDQYH